MSRPVSPARAAPPGSRSTCPSCARSSACASRRPRPCSSARTGPGKSTVLEALAIAARAITAGSAEAVDDATLAGVRLARRRAPAVLGHADAPRVLPARRGLLRLRATGRRGCAPELEEGLAAVDAEYAGRPGLAHDLARTPYLRELSELERRYGEGLDAQSHGESFLRFFAARLVPRGTYFLDEPEAPLSPGRQLALLALLREMLDADCQLVIATHSPILLALPGAAIWSFDEAPIRPVAWDDLEHVRLTRDFLANPDAFLRHL